MLLLLPLLMTANLFYGQTDTCSCIDALDDITYSISHSRSYKVQIRSKEEKQALLDWKAHIEKEIQNDSLKRFFCVGYLQKFGTFIKDQHNQIYTDPDSVPTTFPVYRPNGYTSSTEDSISGNYYAGKEQINLVKVSDSTWLGIMVASTDEKWNEGTIRLKINLLPTGNYELFEFYPNGLLFYRPHIAISGNRIHATFWNKDNTYYFYKNHEQTFHYNSVAPQFDYVGIKTLSRTTQRIKEAKAFYDSLPALDKENLIIDLRNNGGGATLQIKPLLKRVKKNKAIKHIYVIINFKTASAAELAVLELKKDPRTIVVGENSRGMMAYGYGNNSYSGEIPCKNVMFSYSTKHAPSKPDDYEYKGITPDVLLNNQSDWIEQILQLRQ